MNPVEFERRFLEFLEQLDETDSLKQRWLLVYQFLKPIQEDPPQYESYLLQLAPKLPIYEDPLSFTGIDPEIHVQILSLLKKCRQTVPGLESNEFFNQSYENLLGATCLLFGFLGELHLIVRLLQEHQVLDSLDSQDLKQIQQLEQDGSISNYEKLKILTVTLLEEENKAANKLARNVLAQWRNFKRQKKQSALIPVVEVTDKDLLQDYPLGRLRNLKVEVLRRINDRDQFKSTFRVYGAEKVEKNNTTHVLDAARFLIRQLSPELKHSYYELQSSYEIKFGWHKGRSSEATAAALAYESIVHFENLRTKQGLKPGVALTGEVDEDGNLRSVDDAGIQAKVNAAFFSWSDYLVVPKKQESTFERYLANLNNKYPSKQLSLIGISNLEELFHDRRLTYHHIESIPSYWAKKAWKQKFRAAGFVTISVLLAVIGYLIYGPIDKNPVSAEFVESSMSINNKYGNVIERINVGEGTVFYANQRRSVSEVVDFMDLNNDGLNEIIWTENRFKADEKTVNYLMCRRVEADSLMWKVPLSFSLEFPRKPAATEHSYYLHRIESLNTRDSRTPFLIAGLNHNGFFPSLTVKIDAFTGKIKSTYVHTGHVKDMVTVDIDNDHTDEVLWLGTNNAFNQASVFTVLDSSDMQGHSPLTDDYRVNGWKRASEVTYIRIPRTVVGRAFRKRLPNNVPGKIYPACHF